MYYIYVELNKYLYKEAYYRIHNNVDVVSAKLLPVETNVTATKLHNSDTIKLRPITFSTMSLHPYGPYLSNIHLTI